MSTREIAMSLFDRLTEQDMHLFIELFGRYYHLPQAVSDEGHTVPEDKNMTASPEEDADISARLTALERMKKMSRYIPDLDEKKELAEYREEKYGI